MASLDVWNQALSRQSFVASEVDSDGRIDIFSSARIVVEDRDTVVGTIIALDGQLRWSPHFFCAVWIEVDCPASAIRRRGEVPGTGMNLKCWVSASNVRARRFISCTVSRKSEKSTAKYVAQRATGIDGGSRIL